MRTYDDEAIALDAAGIVIKNYWYPGHRRHIPYGAIASHTSFETGALSGRFRLVGFGLRRPFHFFHWDRRRSGKRVAIALDLGRRVRPVISPDDHLQVLAALDERSPKLRQPTM